MSDKRPGARDISELKARLGLKKAGPAKAGGVIPPPGARLTGAIPAPPGAAPPRPHIPDANQDPFGAMNALAAHGAAAAQPQIVIVNDGAPVESVERKSKAGRLGMVAAIFLIPLVLGVAIGKISASAKAFNQEIDDAGRIRDDVKVIGKSLISVQQVLQVGKERGQGGNAFALGDAKLTADLESLKLVQPSFALLTQVSLSGLGDALAQETLELYSETTALNAAIKTHIDKAKAEAKILEEGQVKLGSFNPSAYAATVQIPDADQAKQGIPVTIRLVQLGNPVCQGETKPSDAGCKGLPAGFQFRADETAPWGVKKLAAVATGADPESLVLLDPSSKVLMQLVKGGGATVAEAAYMQRINDISDKVDKLVEIRKDVETKLNNVSNRSKRFTFFL